MSKPRRNSSGVDFKQILHALFAEGLPLGTETVHYVILSQGDIILTWILLSGGDHVESNPVARWFLHHWGLRGLIYFKFAMVAFVCLISQWIARYRLETARRVLNLASVAVGLVIVYSIGLLLRSQGVRLPL